MRNSVVYCLQVILSLYLKSKSIINGHISPNLSNNDTFNPVPLMFSTISNSLGISDDSILYEPLRLELLSYTICVGS